MQQYIDYITKKCHEANDRLLHIWLWLRVKMKNPHWVEWTGIILHMNEAGNYLVLTEFNTKTTVKRKDIKELLWHPITPQEILKVMPHWWMMKFDTRNYEMVNMEWFGRKWFKNQYIICPDSPITEWSESTLRDIAEQLGFNQ